jgi:membrane-bound metal-dependent hydrolase YbcI (DUF457 family)
MNINIQNPFCKYKDVLGIPDSKTGLRKYRIFGIALFDTAVVLVLAVLLAWLFQLSYAYTIAAIFILGIFVHRLFCVRTAVDKILFG